MTTLALTDVEIFAEHIELQSYTNQIETASSAEMLDATTFADNGWRSFVAGLRTADFRIKGFQDYADPDTTLRNLVGSSSAGLLSVVPEGSAHNNAAVFGQFKISEYTRPWAIGTLAEFNLTAKGHGVFVENGRLAFVKTNVSGDTDGTGVQFVGGVSATESLYAAVHVFSAGTTIDVDIETDSTSGFPSPTSVASTTLTGTAGTLLSAAGAITDEHYRVAFTTVTGTFSVAVLIGVA